MVGAVVSLLLLIGESMLSLPPPHDVTPTCFHREEESRESPKEVVMPALSGFCAA